MNEPQRIVEDIYDDGLGSVVRLIADDLNIDTTRGVHEPLLEPDHTPQSTSEDAAYMEPGSHHSPVYVGRKRGLTVSTRARQLNEAYAAITGRPSHGPYIEPLNDTELAIHHHDPEAPTQPVKVEERDVPLIDKDNLAHYLQAPHPTEHETGVTTIKINPSQSNKATFDVTNAEAYHIRRILNIEETPLVGQTTNPSYVRDRNISTYS